jgi:L-fuculose-phosphate aldolase
MRPTGRCVDRTGEFDYAQSMTITLHNTHSKERELRQQMVEVFRLMYQYRYIVAGDGNVSVRLGPEEILITPSGVPKGHMKPEDMVVMDLQGNKVRKGQYGPSSERRIHLEIYRIRPDIQAVVHAHPMHCIAFSLAGLSLAQCLLPEVIITLGSIPTTAYATPTSEDGPVAIRELFKEYNAIILNRHGTVCGGTSLMEAYNRLETIEHTAHITYIARQLGGVEPLPKDEVLRLMQLGAMFGQKPKVEGIDVKNPPCEKCNACPHGKLGQPENPGALTAVLNTLH